MGHIWKNLYWAHPASQNVFQLMFPPSCIQTKINAYIFMSHLKLKVFQKLQIKCSHLGTAGKDENEWKECFTSILGKSGAILKKLLPRELARKLTPTTHGDRDLFLSMKHITLALRASVICFILKNGCRFLIVFPFSLPGPPRALYKLGRVGKRAAPKAQQNFFSNSGAVANLFWPMYICPR